MDRRAVYGPRDGTVLSQQLQHRSDDIPEGEATITLEDVQIIWALPIDGLPVTVSKAKRQLVVHCNCYRFGLWSRIIPLSPGLGVERLYMDQVQVNIDRFLPAAPYGAIWNCRHNFTRTVRTTVRVIRDILDNMQEDQFIWQPYDMDSDRIMAYAADFTPELWRSTCPLIFYAIVEIHHPERVLRQFGMRQNIPEMPDSRDMTLHQISRKARTGTDWGVQHILHIRRWQRRRDTIVNRPPISNERHTEHVEGLSRLLDRYDATLDNICQFVMHSNQNPTNENDPSTSHRQRRSNSRMSTTSAERDNIGVDIAGPSTAYTPQDYYVPQPSQQDDWFQSAPYMPSHAESYSAHVDLDLGLGVNQPYAPEYNVSPIPFPSFSAYRDQVESSSATTSSRLHINDDDDDNEQDEPTQNIVEEIRRPRRQRHRRNCGTGGHF
ncbi:UNVERIFIED_CONTAM: Serine/threonine-protein phosphatase 7 long form [Sesamum radiatum]|uniref:Serine/threonine-protein phosphatase 7 long form n=1 Tax=Sesamum radiatum TaxID=300843 RepID=A0AAW2VQU2_SESRA